MRALSDVALQVLLLVLRHGRMGDPFVEMECIINCDIDDMDTVIPKGFYWGQTVQLQQ